jgi:adenylate cyclase
MPIDIRERAARLFLSVPDGLTGEDARQYMFLKIGSWLAAACHASWVVVFALNGVPFMAWYNVFVSVLFAASGIAWLRYAGPMWYVLGLWLIEVPLHALLGTLFTGLETLFWLVPLTSAVLCLIISQFSWQKRAILSGLMTAISGVCGMLTLFVSPLVPLSDGSTLYLFVTNFIGILASIVMYLGINQYLVKTAETRLTEEFNRAEGLLRNILPDPIALRLKDGERVIANEHKEVSVIFADIVDFTAASAKLTPGELVETLNIIFSEFDALSDKYRAEKIKTIGDAYMVVVGVPDTQRGHAEVAVELALEMQRAAAALRGRTRFDVRLRIGVNSGPVVAGVIGQRKFAYDLWGDAVNVASRMESHGIPGQVMVTEDTAKLLPERFAVVPEGMREVKGKGPTPVFSVEFPVGADPAQHQR